MANNTNNSDEINYIYESPFSPFAPPNMYNSRLSEDVWEALKQTLDKLTEEHGWPAALYAGDLINRTFQELIEQRHRKCQQHFRPARWIRDNLTADTDLVRQNLFPYETKEIRLISNQLEHDRHAREHHEPGCGCRHDKERITERVEDKGKCMLNEEWMHRHPSVDCSSSGSVSLLSNSLLSDDQSRVTTNTPVTSLDGVLSMTGSSFVSGDNSDGSNDSYAEEGSHHVCACQYKLEKIYIPLNGKIYLCCPCNDHDIFGSCPQYPTPINPTLPWNTQPHLHMRELIRWVGAKNIYVERLQQLRDHLRALGQID